MSALQQQARRPGFDARSAPGAIYLESAMHLG